jgi:hypothetical protein
MVSVFVGLLALLHLLEPAFIGRLISEYQLSRHGWMMSSAFGSFGVGAMLLAQVIPADLLTRSGRLGRAGLWLVGTALFAAGLFPPVRTRPVVFSRLDASVVTACLLRRELCPARLGISSFSPCP